MLSHQAYLIEQFQQASKNDGATSQRPEHLGTSRTLFGLKNAIRRDIIYKWIKDNRDIDYDDWISLVDGLYHGESYEERCTPPTLFSKYPNYRQQIPISQLDTWLGQLEGWAEVDSTCQSVFTAKEILSDWGNWQVFLEQLTQDKNINKRRASLVLLTTPITNSPDERLIQQALENVDVLTHEKDRLITKVISWILRKGVKQHRTQIESYLDKNKNILPAIAVRETRRKLETGKK
jgi:hypothetical protein